MKLHVHELDGTLEQQVTTNQTHQIQAIRPHIYVKHGSLDPSAKLWMEVHSETGFVARSTDLFIGEIAGPFFHGLVRFDISIQIQPGTYALKLCSNFAFSESGFVGWCSDFDFKTYPADYDFSQALLLAPKRYEVWALKHI